MSNITQIKMFAFILLVNTNLLFACSKTEPSGGSSHTIIEPGKETPKDQQTVKHTGSIFSIPLAGNAFVTSSGSSESINSTKGLVSWVSSNAVISTYVKLASSGSLRLSVMGKTTAAGENSSIKVTVNGVSKTIKLSSENNTDIMAGDFNATQGYVKIDLQGISKSGNFFGEISDIKISGTAVSKGVLFSNKTDYYYWARRGPSCHLKYSLPTTENTSYYYSEITVPQNEDKIGSYFMANGFAEGYFGFQVNSSTERRVLFSVWSPYTTDDPTTIPDEYKIVLNKKGTDVYTGEFGNEGSGGQSYLKYNWKSATTYKFLLKGEPDGNGNTNYTAWFFAPEVNEWKLIASFKRPKTNTYLKNFHSFLENFNPNNGHLGRSANYHNQCIRTTAGVWKKITDVTFTVDATYSNQQRIDAIGGSNATGFFLKNGGFFNEVVAPNSKFSFNNSNSEPQIDFTKLP